LKLFQIALTISDNILKTHREKKVRVVASSDAEFLSVKKIFSMGRGSTNKLEAKGVHLNN